MGAGGKAGVAVAWAVSLVLLSQWSNTDAAQVLAVVATLVAAALVDTWWLVALPVPPALLLIAGSLTGGSELDADGFSGWDWAGVIAAVATGIALLLAAGVAGRRGARRQWALRAQRTRTQ